MLFRLENILSSTHTPQKRFLTTQACTEVHIVFFSFLWSVVWGAWWFTWSLLESSWVGLQLHFPAIWICHPAYCLCKVSTFSYFKSKYNFFSHLLCVNAKWVLVSFPMLLVGLVKFCSNIYYINDNLDKRTWTYIFGACCATTVFIPSFHNYRIWSFLGLGMTTYTAWYMTIAALVHGQVNVKPTPADLSQWFLYCLSAVDLTHLLFFWRVLQAEGVVHSGPTKLVLYFTGATNILYTFGGHAVTVWVVILFGFYCLVKAS